jgi:hypothetical protein
MRLPFFLAAPRIDAKTTLELPAKRLEAVAFAYTKFKHKLEY